jgi:subtilisin family serine protease
MKIKIKIPLDVRVGSPGLKAPCFQHLAPGSEIEVDGTLYKGDSFQNIDDWYKDDANNYYWSGAVEVCSNAAITSSTDLIDYRKLFAYIEPNWFSTNGRGIKVGVIDTGFYPDHPDLLHVKQTARIKDCAGNGGNCNDIKGHGTNVLGLMAASQTSDNLIGLIPEASFFLYKAYRDHVGFIDSFVADAINECISQGVDIINLSLAITTYGGSALEIALQDAITHNIILVAAAGEENDLVQASIAYPAQFPAVIGLGETSAGFLQTLNQPINSNVDFLLPLENIKTCCKNNSSGKYYESMSGSSMGSALLTGILASALSAGISKPNLIATLRDHCEPYSSSIFNHATLKIVKV